MHELSICIALVEQVNRVMREHRASAVERIVLEVGPLSGVEAPQLQHAWLLAAIGTAAEEAEFVIETAPLKVRCTRCDAVSAVVANRLVCASCGDCRTQLVSGDEMLLTTLELSGIEDRVA